MSTLSFPIEVLRDHRLPENSVALEPKFCENCSRTFFRKQTSTASLCNGCRQMLTSENNQIMQCLKCGMERNYGAGTPEESGRNRKLHCDHCAQVTEHEYRRCGDPGKLD